MRNLLNQVLFYEDEYYLFSNWSAHSIYYEGIEYKTVEHTYQCQKFSSETRQGRKLREQLIQQPSPAMAKQFAYENIEYILKNWEQVRVKIMFGIIRAKVHQHKDVSAALLKTGTSIIAEDSPVDYFWGLGLDRSGKNMLGKIWMTVRSELTPK